MLNEAKESPGGLAWPEPYGLSFAPQHSTEPSVLTPHVCSPPALTEAKDPSGGLDWPEP